MEWLMGQATKRYGDKRGFVSRSVVIRLHGGPHGGTRAEVETLNDTKVIVNHATREVAAYRRVADVDYGYSVQVVRADGEGVGRHPADVRGRRADVAGPERG
jgi:hypothetical protein